MTRMLGEVAAGGDLRFYGFESGKIHLRETVCAAETPLTFFKLKIASYGVFSDTPSRPHDAGGALDAVPQRGQATASVRAYVAGRGVGGRAVRFLGEDATGAESQERRRRKVEENWALDMCVTSLAPLGNMETTRSISVEPLQVCPT